MRKIIFLLVLIFLGCNSGPSISQEYTVSEEYHDYLSENSLIKVNLKGEIPKDEIKLLSEEIKSTSKHENLIINFYVNHQLIGEATFLPNYNYQTIAEIKKEADETSSKNLDKLNEIIKDDSDSIRPINN